VDPSANPTFTPAPATSITALHEQQDRPMIKRRLKVIGIGAGNPEYITIQAVKALQQVTTFFIPLKGDDKADLHLLRREICDRYINHDHYRMVDFDIPDRARDGAYRTDVSDWRAAVRAIYLRLLTEELGETDLGAFLVWGDPSLYDGTIGIIEDLRAAGMEIEYEVIPGISSVSALAARHKVALNRIGQPFTVMSARQLEKGLPEEGNVVVMLDTRDAYRDLGADLDIHWGAYVGTEDEILRSGRLSDLQDEITDLRKKARAEKGWIMDSYLLSRRSDPKD
jgi:precorrin-6A synthase